VQTLVAGEDEEGNGRMRRGKEANVYVGPVALEKKRGERPEKKKSMDQCATSDGIFLLYPFFFVLNFLGTLFFFRAEIIRPKGSGGRSFSWLLLRLRRCHVLATPRL
jgi:hypothetical protein